jgi:hypothetical protein
MVPGSWFMARGFVAYRLPLNDGKLLHTLKVRIKRRERHVALERDRGNLIVSIVDNHVSERRSNSPLKRLNTAASSGFNSCK